VGFKIMQIEASNLCSLRCVYCPHPSQIRPKGNMTMETFAKCIELVKRSDNPERQGNQRLHLNHFGEPLLNPLLPQFVSHASSRNVEVSLATNGVDHNKNLFSRDLWRELAEAGLKSVVISCHVKSETELRDHIGDLVDIGWVFKPTPDQLHTWAGQVHLERFNQKYLKIPDIPCDYQMHNMFAVTWDGKIAACCYDIEGRVSLSVDDVLNEAFVFRRISLCDTCGLGRGDVSWIGG
jgi:hypothetical protein